MIYQIIVAYFSSKVINPYRKCNLYQDLLKEARLEGIDPLRKKDIDLALQIIDQQYTKGDKLKEIVKGQPLTKLYRACSMVGYILGDVLYDNFYEEEQKDFHSILAVIFECLNDEIKFNQFKWTILPLNDYKNFKKRFF